MSEQQLFTGTEFEIPDDTPAPGELCLCGCGQVVPRNKYGRPRRYVSPLHRERAKRLRREAKAPRIPRAPSEVFMAMLDAYRFQPDIWAWWEQFLTDDQREVVRVLSQVTITYSDAIQAIIDLQRWRE